MDTPQLSPRPTILVVDDTPENLALMSALLKDHYKVKVANGGEKALRIAQSEPPPDLVLLDIMMPEMDGYQVLERLKSDARTRDVPVIFLTAKAEVDDETRGLELGAVDYITKPISPAIVLARVRTQLQVKQAADLLKNQNISLEREIARRMAENDLTQQVSIRALAHLAETRDPETGNHILRTQAYVQHLAQTLRRHPRFAAMLNDQYINLLGRSAPLHDIGKVGIPDHILLKPGKLNAEEWAIMQTHAQLGSEAIERAEADIEMPLDFLSLAKEIARWHHEKWDGSGYPDGLSGEAIPLSARLMALADVFDALISPRVYKPPMSFAEARSIIHEGRGKHFDPDIVDAFIADFSAYCAIAERYHDAEDLAEAGHESS